jgi:hypothetical protein
VGITAARARDNQGKTQGMRFENNAFEAQTAGVPEDGYGQEFRSGTVTSVSLIARLFCLDQPAQQLIE